MPVIVDTDMGSDDARALILLFNSGTVDVRLMVTSDGVLDPGTGQDVLIRLLDALHRPDIPTFRGISLSLDPPQFRELNQSLAWPGESRPNRDFPQAAETASNTIIRAIRSSDTALVYLCLGPMTNLAEALRQDPGIASRIDTVVYLGQSPESRSPGWNTLRDRDAAAAVYASGLRIVGVGLADEDYPLFDQNLMNRIKKQETPLALLLARIHDTPDMHRAIASGHMKVWDEMAVIYMSRPGAFDMKAETAYPASQRLDRFDLAAVLETYLKLLGNPSDFHLDERSSVVLSAFPTDPNLMKKDVAGSVQEIIRRHGLEEWKACLLTNELHRHLGIYSLVGAKMGIRARELLAAPFDSLEVVSGAGFKPPLSCMNDGLQVSTGASLGRGTIRVEEEGTAPSARFCHNGVVAELRLKPEYVARIQSDISEAVHRFGGMGPDYFNHIRQLSIGYWQEFDREKLFDETLTKQRR
ncbi:MAG: nucleoside hydrolase [Pseudomonadota bacterium]